MKFGNSRKRRKSALAKAQHRGNVRNSKEIPDVRLPNNATGLGTSCTGQRLFTLEISLHKILSNAKLDGIIRVRILQQTFHLPPPTSPGVVSPVVLSAAISFVRIHTFPRRIPSREKLSTLGIRLRHKRLIYRRGDVDFQLQAQSPRHETIPETHRSSYELERLCDIDARHSIRFFSDSVTDTRELDRYRTGVRCRYLARNFSMYLITDLSNDFDQLKRFLRSN